MQEPRRVVQPLHVLARAGTRPARAACRSSECPRRRPSRSGGRGRRRGPSRRPSRRARRSSRSSRSPAPWRSFRCLGGECYRRATRSTGAAPLTRSSSTGGIAAMWSSVPAPIHTSPWTSSERSMQHAGDAAMRERRDAARLEAGRLDHLGTRARSARDGPAPRPRSARRRPARRRGRARARTPRRRRRRAT